MAKDETSIGVIVTDIQGDFTKVKNGSLAVEGADEAYVEAVEENTKRLKAVGFPIFATQDWHPAKHVSFFTNHQGKKAFDLVKLYGKDQVLWPPHCVQKTPGAEILLDKELFVATVKKGMNPEYESYSAFQDDGGQTTELHSILQALGVKHLIVYGIATDYCVKASVMDALNLDYSVIVVEDLIRGVAPDTSATAIAEMKAAGAEFVSSVKDVK